MSAAPPAVRIRALARPRRLDGSEGSGRARRTADTGPGGDTDARWFAAAAEVAVRVGHHLWGNDDHTLTPVEQLALSADTEAERWRGWIAVSTGDGTGAVVGLATAVLPQRDNTTTAYIEVMVDPEHRRRGTGSALLAAVERDLRAAGRTVLLAWSEEPGAGPWARTVPARSGAGAVPAAAPTEAFAVARGFALEQVERLGRLDVPLPVGDPRWALAPDVRDTGGAIAGTGGYAVVDWVGPCPADLAEDYARLKVAISADIPTADLDQAPEVWDAARVRQDDDLVAARGGERLTAAIRHLPSGRLVGHTVLERYAARPEVAEQEDTLVLAAHRGHRLGMLLKLHNLRRLQETWPCVRRVYTWNAQENTPMLGINLALGFQQAGVVGAWQKRLD